MYLFKKGESGDLLKNFLYLVDFFFIIFKIKNKM